MCESDDDILCPSTVDFKESAFIDDTSDNLVHVICLVRVVRDNFVQSVVMTTYRVAGLYRRCLFAIVRRQETEKSLDGLDAFFFVFCCEVGNSAFFRMYGSATEVLL